MNVQEALAWADNRIAVSMIDSQVTTDAITILAAEVRRLRAELEAAEKEGHGLATSLAKWRADYFVGTTKEEQMRVMLADCPILKAYDERKGK